MSYPEGTPLRWDDRDPDMLFVVLAHKGVDISWISAMINKQTVVSPGLVSPGLVSPGLDSLFSTVSRRVTEMSI